MSLGYIYRRREEDNIKYRDDGHWVQQRLSVWLSQNNRWYVLHWFMVF